MNEFIIRNASVKLFSFHIRHKIHRSMYTFRVGIIKVNSQYNALHPANIRVSGSVLIFTTQFA